MNVVEGASGEICEVLVAVSEAFLSIATLDAVRPIVHMMTRFGQSAFLSGAAATLV
jgi:hypothetical protein